jgi:hypothetical protein
VRRGVGEREREEKRLSDKVLFDTDYGHVYSYHVFFLFSFFPF